MSLIGWDMKLAQWLHNTLLLHMSTPYIASYLDILQTLKSKIPTLIDRMISNSFSQKRPNFEALNLLLKRPWDPVSPIFNQFKPLKMENLPIVIQVPSGAGMPDVPLNLRRFRFINIQLQHLVKYVAISHTSDTSDGITVLDCIISDVRKKILEYKEQFPTQPIVLLGWGVGALLACHISLVEKVSANICLGFPMKTFDGMRGGSKDPLLGMTTPTLFVIGQNSTDVNIDRIEEFRQHLQIQTSLVVIAGGGNLMKVSADKCYIDGITQSMVDRCIVDEIGEFLTRVFNEVTNNKESSAISSSSNFVSSGSTIAFTNPLPPKTNRKELSRKRKLSPSNFSDSGSIQSLSKTPKTTETRTAISQNLGLKIPIGVSSVTPSLKCEKSLSMSSPNSHVHFSVASKSAANITDLPLEVSDPNLKRQSGLLKDGSSTFRLQSGSDSNIDLSISKSVVSSIDSCTLSSGSLSPMATIALGALASVSRQKYQRMIQISDSSDAPLSDNKNIYGWNSKPSGKSDPDIGIVGINSVANLSSGTRGDFPKRPNSFVKRQNSYQFLLTSYDGGNDIEFDKSEEMYNEQFNANILNCNVPGLEKSFSQNKNLSSNFFLNSSLICSKFSRINSNKNCLLKKNFMNSTNIDSLNGHTLIPSVKNTLKSLVHKSPTDFVQQIYHDNVLKREYQVLQTVKNSKDIENNSSKLFFPSLGIHEVKHFPLQDEISMNEYLECNLSNENIFSPVSSSFSTIPAFDSASEFSISDPEVKKVPQQHQKQYSKPILITMPSPIMSLIPIQDKCNAKSIIDVESIKDERLNQCMNGKQSMMLQNSRDFLFPYNSPKSGSSIYKPLTSLRGQPGMVYNRRSIMASATAKSSGIDSSQILVTSSLVNPPVVQKNRRGRPAKNKGLTSYRPIKAMIPSSSSASKSFFSPTVSQQNSDGIYKERSSMAVLTLTGNAGDGTGVEVAGKGISSLGRGVLTLAKGGTSTVRVYSASSHKHSAVTSGSSNYVHPSQKTARGSLLFTNITASTIGTSKATDVTTISQSSPKVTPIMKRTNSAITTGQLSLNLQGISASRNVNVLSTASHGVSRPTVMILTNASREEALKNCLSSTTTTTTISSSGVKTTKSVIGLRMTVPSMKSNFDFPIDSGDNITLANNATIPLQGSSELDLLASASELYKKEEINVVLQEPSLDAFNGRNTSSVIEYKDSKRDNHVTMLQTESTSRLPSSAIKSNITFINAKSMNKPSYAKDTLTPLLPRQSTGLQSFPSCSSHKVPSSKTSSIRFIRTVGNQQPPVFKTAAVGTTSTGKIVTKTFTVNSTNTGMITGTTKNTISFGRNYLDAEKTSRGTSTDFHLLDTTYQTAESNATPQYVAKKCIKNLNENFQKVKKYGTLKQSNPSAKKFNIDNFSEETVKKSAKLTIADNQKRVETGTCLNADELNRNEMSTDGTSISDTIPIMKIQTTMANSSIIDKNKKSLYSTISENKSKETVDETLHHYSDPTVLVSEAESPKKCYVNPIIRITTSSKQSQFCSAVNSNPISVSTSDTASDLDTSLQTKLLNVSPLALAESTENVTSKCIDTINTTSSDLEKSESAPLKAPEKFETLKVASIETSTTDTMIAPSTDDKESSPETLKHATPTRPILTNSDHSADSICSKKQQSKIFHKDTPAKTTEEGKQSNKSRLRITRSVSKSPAEKKRSLR